MASVIADLDSDGAIMEEEKVEALRLMPVPTLSRDVIQKYAMSVGALGGAAYHPLAHDAGASAAAQVRR